MATDFTFIFGSRQEIRGVSKTFTFRTPNVDTSQGAVLMFHARGVVSRAESLQINGQNIGNGVPRSPSKDDWTGHVLLVPSGVLNENGDNVMELGDRGIRYFVDNCVLFYKTL